jgi:hypothetical protein
MIPVFRRSFLLVLGLGVGQWFLPASLAQTLPSATATPVAATIVKSPPVPVVKSPVDAFRELLAMSAAERGHYLSNRPPEVRKRIEDKLREYEVMQPAERELTLRTTELGWYLLPLMKMEPANRAAQLDRVPEADRPLIDERLQKWDLLSPAEQKEVLQYDATTAYFVPTEAPGKTQKHPEPPKPETARKWDDFFRLPVEQRREIYARSETFFRLTEADRQKTLLTLPEPERQQMEKTLEVFEKMPKDQQERCIRAFGRLAGMTEEERQEFLVNAGRWSEMSRAERQAWRNLVQKLPEPPLPPGLRRPPMPPPPIPVAPRPTGSLSLATNSSQ